MAKRHDKIRQARELLEQERNDVRDALAQAREEGQEIARAQKAWRERAAALLDRGNAAGLSVTEMARALGLSRQWTTHLRAEAARRERLAKVRIARVERRDS